MSPASYRAAPPRVGSDPPYVSLLAKPNRLGLDSTWRRGPLKPVCRLGFPYGLKHVGTLRERGQRAALRGNQVREMPGSRMKLIDCGFHDSSHKMIITALTGHCYLSRRRSAGSLS